MLGSLLCRIGKELISGSAIGSGLNWTVLLVLPESLIQLQSVIDDTGAEGAQRVQAGLPQASGAAGYWLALAPPGYSSSRRVT